MKVDILLRTRDYDRDYRWIFKPEYVDRVTEDKMSFLIQMMQKSELKQYLENESLYNLYYLYDENGSALVRSGFSGSMDRQGRNIYAVEGIACPAEMNRIWWTGFYNSLCCVSNGCVKMVRKRMLTWNIIWRWKA